MVLPCAHLPTVLLHVAVAVLISVDQLEHEVVDVDARADEQVARCVVLGQLHAVALLPGLLDATALQELAADDA